MHWSPQVSQFRARLPSRLIAASLAFSLSTASLAQPAATGAETRPDAGPEADAVTGIETGRAVSLPQDSLLADSQSDDGQLDALNAIALVEAAPPEWVANACTNLNTRPKECDEVPTHMVVGRFEFPDTEDSAAVDGARPGVYYESANTGQHAARRVRPVFKCSNLGVDGVKERFFQLARSFFNRTGFDIFRQSAPRSISAHGADRATGNIHLFAHIDLRLYREGTMDGQLGCNIMANIFLATRENGQVTINTRGHAGQFRQLLAADLTSI